MRLNLSFPPPLPSLLPQAPLQTEQPVLHCFQLSIKTEVSASATARLVQVSEATLVYTNKCSSSSQTDANLISCALVSV